MPVSIDQASWHHTPENLKLYHHYCKNFRCWLPYITSLIELGMLVLEPCEREVSILAGVNIPGTTSISFTVFQALENHGLNTCCL